MPAALRERQGEQRAEQPGGGQPCVVAMPAQARSQAQQLIEERGGECQSAVTAKTTLVIAGEAAGSKLDKAKKLGIKIIDEAEFKKML